MHVYISLYKETRVRSQRRVVLKFSWPSLTDTRAAPPSALPLLEDSHDQQLFRLQSLMVLEIKSDEVPPSKLLEAL